ncbi:nucleophile aminohydrolase [Plectosphaerella plurivora]|uniref:Nucleophile aminohydrolase n=1 Tax=Plectosphaerella plurivora TaxID=936078 RepID=A0A9P9AA03_9PEZI|nr:nucleophile aminohydrolase [Plectosphaerella plurivora]
MLPLTLLLAAATSVSACSRVAYNADAKPGGRITMGRTLDFVTPTNSTIYAFPAGLKRNGGIEDNPLQWTSKYGSATAIMFNLVFTEGLNTEGLTGSALYLGGSDYGTRDSSIPGLSVGNWLQYFLDMYATVNETVTAVCPQGGQPAKFQVVPKEVLPGIKSHVHLAFTDKSGDNVIMEYVGGKLTCWHSVEYNIMTNEPTFDQQLAIREYWAPVANYSLPGSPRPADRFVRLSNYAQKIPTAKDLTTAVSYTAGLVRAVSNPMFPVSLEAVSTEDTWPTYWRTYIDLVDGMFFYESTTSPLLVWFSIKDFDLSTSGKIAGLYMTGEPWRELSGDVTTKFKSVSSDTCKQLFTEC